MKVLASQLHEAFSQRNGILVSSRAEISPEIFEFAKKEVGCSGPRRRGQCGNDRVQTCPLDSEWDAFHRRAGLSSPAHVPRRSERVDVWSWHGTRQCRNPTDTKLSVPIVATKIADFLWLISSPTSPSTLMTTRLPSAASSGQIATVRWSEKNAHGRVELLFSWSACHCAHISQSLLNVVRWEAQGRKEKGHGVALVQATAGLNALPLATWHTQLS